MSITRFLARFYATLVRLYPRDYRLEFGEEMQDVFSDAVIEANSDGGEALLIVCLRELRDCPGNLLAEHRWQIRRRFTEKLTRHYEERACTPGMVPEGVGSLAYMTVFVTGENMAAGRLFDLTFASFWLLLTAPLLLLIAVMIKLDSRGPVFFLQDRVGRDGQRFTMYKFRSMEISGEIAGDTPEIASDEKPPNGVRCARRLTRVGRVIRKVNLDEVPQL